MLRSTRIAIVLLFLTALPATAQVLRDDLWVTNGGVFASTVLDNKLYLGGSFNRVGPATGGLMPVRTTTGQNVSEPMNLDGSINAMIPDGAGGWYVGGSFRHLLGQARSSLARINANGELRPWNPGCDGVVKTLALSGGVVYIGGSFAHVAGQPRSHLAAVDTVNGGIVAGWTPSPDGVVNSIAVSTGLVYCGGAFTNIGGALRPKLAAVAVSNGAASGWQPYPNGDVYTIGVIYDVIDLTTRVYIGGAFTTVQGFPRQYLATVDATPGSPNFANPNSFNPAPNGFVRALIVFGRTITTLYVGGDFNTIAGQPRGRLAAFSGTTLGAWNPGANSSVVSMRLDGSTMYVGGQFSTLGGQSRLYAGAVSAPGGVATAWDPQVNGPVRVFNPSGATTWIGGDFTSVGCIERANLAAFDLATGQPTAWNPGSNGPVYALETINSLIYAGGNFTSIGGASRLNVAQLDANGGVGSWNPSPNNIVNAIAGSGDINGTTIYLGGAFTSVMSTPRNRLAAVNDAPIPSLSAWNPNADGTVNAIAIDGPASHIYVGGSFTGFASTFSRQYIAQLTLAGTPTSWFPLSGAPVNAIALANNLVYAGFNGQAVIGNAVRQGIAALNKNSNNATAWDPQVVGNVYSILPSGSTLFIGGSFSQVANAPRGNLAEIDASTGATTSFNAPTWSFESLYGVPSQQPGVVDLVETNGGDLYAAGAFTSILDKPHSAIAGLYQVSVSVDPAVTPPALALRAAPNPARASQVLQFDLPTAAQGRVVIHDVHGRLVRVLAAGVLAAGPQRLEWDGRTAAGARVAPGIYFVRITAGTDRSTLKIVRVD
jgi:hypothetical protein